jgi:hypothetical protein
MNRTALYMKAAKDFRSTTGKDRVKGEIFIATDAEEKDLERQRLAWRFYCISLSDEIEVKRWLDRAQKKQN